MAPPTVQTPHNAKPTGVLTRAQRRALDASAKVNDTLMGSTAKVTASKPAAPRRAKAKGNGGRRKGDGLDQMAPVVGYRNGVPERRLKKLISGTKDVLGVGHYGAVLGINGGLCIKMMHDVKHFEDMI